LLAAVGIYGVMSGLVAQRTNEFGIRMAFGAQAADILRLVFGKSMSVAGVGLLAGLAIAAAVARIFASELFEVSAADPFTIVLALLLLASVALLACYLPARRATRVDPMVALRCE
jgi:putative ABC transport system permease protein